MSLKFFVLAVNIGLGIIFKAFSIKAVTPNDGEKDVSFCKLNNSSSSSSSPTSSNCTDLTDISSPTSTDFTDISSPTSSNCTDFTEISSPTSSNCTDSKNDCGLDDKLRQIPTKSTFKTYSSSEFEYKKNILNFDNKIDLQKASEFFKNNSEDVTVMIKLSLDKNHIDDVLFKNIIEVIEAATTKTTNFTLFLSSDKPKTTIDNIKSLFNNLSKFKKANLYTHHIEISSFDGLNFDNLESFNINNYNVLGNEIDFLDNKKLELLNSANKSITCLIGNKFLDLFKKSFVI